MARLNDFAAPAESVEALKRRFVRQNRDIVRVNSMQSLRIRSLESEVSHLLAENVSLREQIINLTQENERFESAHMLHEGIYDIKSRLDAKLAELSTLASDLGMLPRKVGRLAADKAGTDSDRPRATVSESRPRATDGESNGAFEDGRLPAIVEDKYYPRRTLEQQEIENLVHTESGLESPPRESLRLHEEPDITAESPRPDLDDIPSQTYTNKELAHDETALPPTLETRKKKKKVVSATAIPKTSPQKDQSLAASQPLEPAKSGSKRKFSPDEDGFLSDLAPEDDEFQFTRPGGSPLKRLGSFDLTRPDFSPSKTPVGGKSGSAHTEITKRKVLEPKSANSNLGSPKKMRASSNSDIKGSKGLFKAGANENTLSPQKPKAIDVHQMEALSEKPRVARLATATLKPKRAGRSIETDVSSDVEPKSTRPQDSPVAKAGDSAFGVSEMNAASRPSRRRGAVVSYAEPNLRDKMRRPSKNFIDAVAGAGPRRSSSFQLARDSLGHDAEASQSTTRSADLASANQATEHLAQDSSDEHSLSTTVSRRRRKASSSTKDLDENPGATLTTGAPDLTDMSSALKEKSSSRSQSRRHSSNPKSTSRDSSRYRYDADLASDLDSSFEADDTAYRRETRVAARRKSMMV